MHLVVAGADLPFAVDDETAVGELAIVEAYGERADVEPDAVALRRIPACGEHEVFILIPEILRGARAIAVEQA